MDHLTISNLTARQRRFYNTGVTQDVRYRTAALKRLRKVVEDHEKELAMALRQDLGKSATESYMCEIGMVLSELTWLLKNLRRLTRDQRVPTPLHQFPATSFRRPTPYGVTLIMSPWNYPVLLTLGPLADAIAAGNTAVVKPSAYAPATSRLLARLLGSIYPAAYVEVVEGGREENGWLLEERFDYIFFTGSPHVGRLVLEQAAKHLTPVTLELGGKSPCIIHRSADLASAARKVVFGKFLNCGQTCVAPDYVLCDEAVREKFLRHLRLEIERQYGKEYKYNLSYGRIVSKKHFDRLTGLIDGDKVFLGGAWDKEALRIEPTVLTDVGWEDPVMEGEIFGPILPVLTFSEPEEVVELLRDRPKPLAFYVFARDKGVIDRLTRGCQFGGGCINDVIVHLASTQLAFGGVGESGMGSYHGKAGFDTFTHYKSILHSRLFDLPMRYQPYRKVWDMLIRFFLR